MAKPRFLVENYFSDVMFPTHVLSDDSEVVGHEVWRVGTGRRSTRNYWTPTTTNAIAYVQVDCGVHKSPDMLVIDRAHNLAGATITLLADDAGFSGGEVTVFTGVVPSAYSAGSALTVGGGIVWTEEGALIKLFTPVAKAKYRLKINAMGAGIAPRIGGLWLGVSYQPSYYLDLPYDTGLRDLRVEETTMDSYWVGSGRAAQRVAGSFTHKCSSYTEYDNTARYHIESLFLAYKPMWFVFNDEKTERTALIKPAPGVQGYSVMKGWAYPQATISYAEHEPRLR